MNRISDDTKYQERAEIDYSDNEFSEETDDEGGGNKKSIKTIFGAIIAVLAVLVLILTVFFGIRKAKKASDNSDDGTATTLSEEEATSAEDDKETYTAGYYTVTSEGSVRLREDHSFDGEKLKSIPRGKKLKITEIFTDETADKEEAKYWGKTEFEGVTGWVCIAYLTKDGSSGTQIISTTASEKETTTEAEETTTEKATETTTEKPEEKTTTAEPSTEGSSSLGGYSTGKYRFSSSESSLHMRNSASIDGASIADIPSGESFSVTEIKEDPNAADEALRYWGKISYNGTEGWVCMGVLDKG